MKGRALDPYNWVDIEQDAEGERFVTEANQGAQASERAAIPI